MKVVSLMGLLPENYYDGILANSRGAVEFAADALQKSLIAGLSENLTQLDVINLPYLRPWPKQYKKIFSPPSFIEERKSECSHYEIINRRFLNVFGLNMLSRYRVAYNALVKYCKKSSSEDIVVLIYAISTPFIKAAVEAKNRFSNLKIILIAPDMPEYMSENDGLLRSYLKKINNRLLQSLYGKIDGFVVLTKYMAERLVTNNQPFVVVEGIYNPSDDEPVKRLDKSDKKLIVYTGTLDRRYNVMDLVWAVRMLKRDDFVLELYGTGDTQQELIEISSVDSRIKYCGIHSRKEVLHQQRQAFLLVNPRKGNMEFTKYSFPSKTMEYLASGTPTLINHMDGIPNEYYKYCFCPDSDENSKFSQKINEILDMETDVLKRIGLDARLFILEQKNPKTQTRKIVDLISTIIN